MSRNRSGRMKPTRTAPIRRGPMRKLRKPYDFIELARATLLERVSLGDTVREAARKAGVHVDTVYRHVHNDADFAQSFKQALELGAIKIEAELHEHVFRKRPGNVHAARALLNVRRPRDWRERVEVTGRDGKPIEHHVIEEKRVQLIEAIIQSVLTKKGEQDAVEKIQGPSDKA